MLDQMRCAGMITDDKLGKMWEGVVVVACFTVVLQNYMGQQEDNLKSRTQVSQSSVTICNHSLNFKLV
jgi:hypothetical protein